MNDHAELYFQGNTTHTRIAGGALPPGDYRDGETLYQARFEGPEPDVHVDGRAVIIEYPFGFRDLFHRHHRSMDLTLRDDVPWSIAIRGGVHALRADLRAIDLRELTIDGGGNDLTILLGRPRGTVHVRLGGGANGLGVARPAGVPIRTRVYGGACDIRFDTLELGAVGGPTNWESPDFASAMNRFDVEIVGGVNHGSVGVDARTSSGPFDRWMEI